MFGSPAIALFYALGLALIGCAIGVLEGLLLSAVLHIPKRGVWKNAVLGAFGMVGGFLLTAFVPWPENTVTYNIGETVVTSTMARYQHPYYVAFASAFALPVVRALLLHRKKSTTPVA